LNTPAPPNASSISFKDGLVILCLPSRRIESGITGGLLLLSLACLGNATYIPFKYYSSYFNVFEGIFSVSRPFLNSFRS